MGSYVQNESGYIAVYIFTLSLLLFPVFFVLLAILISLYGNAYATSPTVHCADQVAL
jgi:hypothetical protein